MEGGGWWVGGKGRGGVGGQVEADAGFDHLGECRPKWLLLRPPGEDTRRRVAGRDGLMNCLVEQNYIMLVFFKRI